MTVGDDHDLMNRAMALLEAASERAGNLHQDYVRAVNALCIGFERENERLRNVVKTGGAMYRAERASMGIAGGLDREDGLTNVTNVARLAEAKRLLDICYAILPAPGKLSARKTGALIKQIKAWLQANA